HAYLVVSPGRRSGLRVRRAGIARSGGTLAAARRRHRPRPVHSLPISGVHTLMTTLDRLYRKGFLNRVKVGRAFAYRPRYGREELASGIAANALTSLLKEQSVRPVLAVFVEEVSRRDANLLDELARLVDEKRRTQGSTR